MGVTESTEVNSRQIWLILHHKAISHQYYRTQERQQILMLMIIMMKMMIWSGPDQRPYKQRDLYKKIMYENHVWNLKVREHSAVATIV
jgi:hypothetical protein